MYFGIDDDGFIVGVDEIDKIQTRIVNLARKSCEPPLHPKFSIEKIDGKDILIVSVESSSYVHRTNDGDTISEWAQLPLTCQWMSWKN